MKTLGQIAFEAWPERFHDVPWDAAPDGIRARYEAAGQAVRAAVIEEMREWVEEGERLVGNGRQRGSVLMSLGAWWADRPWRSRK
jgi:hypothetical protein